MKRAALVVLWCALASATRAAEAVKLERLQALGSGGPVELKAEQLSAVATGRVVEARGAVVATWGKYRLYAEAVSYDRETAVAVASGSVVLEDEDGNVLKASRLSIQTVTQEGEIEDGELSIVEEGYRVWGRRILKTGPDSYRVDDGGFTACDGTWPSWSVHASRVEVQLEGYLSGRNATFWVEGVPVVYTPYILFPVKRQRQAGFLIPKLGWSRTNGALVAMRYYWPFADSGDLLARLEYRSLRGLTEAAELRYVLAEGHRGSAEASHLYDRKDETHRYTIKADHSSRFDEADRVRLHVDYLGDTGYLRDFGDTIEDRGVERLESYVLATRQAEPGTFFGFADYFEALDQSRSEVLQILPRVGLLGKETPFTAALNVEANAVATRFQRGVGLRGERLELSPVVSWGGDAGGVGFGARAGYRQNLYRSEDESYARGAGWGEVSTSAMLAREIRGFHHTVEPKIAVRAEERGRGADVPEFDARDEFHDRVELGLLCGSRLLRRSDLSEVVALDVEGTLDLAEERGEGADGLHRWKAKGSWSPSERLRLGAAGELDLFDEDPVRHWSANAEASDRRGDRLSFGQYYWKGRANYADGGVKLAVTRELALEYRHAYSLRDERPLEEGVGVHLLHPCWELALTYSRNYLADEDRYEMRYYAQLQLKGLGKIGTLRGVVP